MCSASRMHGRRYAFLKDNPFRFKDYAPVSHTNPGGATTHILASGANDAARNSATYQPLLVLLCLSLIIQPADGLALENNNKFDILLQGMTVKNFRLALGLPVIYRCATTDHISATKDDDASSLSEAERVLLHEAGLVIDLRSDSERDEEQAQAWMSQAPGGHFRIVRDIAADGLFSNDYGQEQPKKQRTLLRLDPLDPSQFMAYLDEHWLSPDQKAKASFYKLLDGERLHNLRMTVLNEKGLIGLNEAILETGKKEMLAGLQAITMHLELSPDDPVVIHCVQGKDRTGLLVMLCQSILGLSDAEIVDCYHQSEARILETSGAATKLQRAGLARGKLDRNVFMAAPKQVMEATLEWLRQKYGSVSPGYLDSIGFDEEWRDRFKKAMLNADQRRSRL